METTPVLRFESFELDTRSRELRSGNRCVRLQEQPFEILRMMLERPGDLVTRDELARRLWPDGTFVDFEHSLNAAVKRLRAALGDNADHPRYVETLPRRGYRFIASLAPMAALSPVQQERIRLAVLPFNNVSGDTSQEYFNDGLTDEMIAQLGRLGRGRIGVIARWSSMAFKGSNRPAREIGDALRADFLLGGSVRREGDKARISAWLVETAGETHLWSDTYERNLTDCLAVQAEVAALIVRSLEAELGGEPVSALSPAPNAAAAQAYLKGRYYWNLTGPAGLDDAVRYYEEALALDPNFAAAAASLARAQIARADYYMERPPVAFEQAHRAVTRALQLDPSMCDAHIAFADLRRLVHWDWRGAETAYTQALSLNPSSEAGHRLYGLLLAALGRNDEAAREARRALELDPLCMIVRSTSAWIKYVAAEYEDAIEQCRISLDLDADFVPARRVLGASLLQLGRTDEALVELEDAVTRRPGDLVAASWLAHAAATAGQTTRALSIIKRVLADGAGHAPAYHVAMAYTALRDRDGAFSALDRASAEHDPTLPYLAVEPRFAPLHADQRFGQLCQRLNLPAGGGQ